jgi:predicted metal-dependent HD superfamily phosphohydrolase
VDELRARWDGTLATLGLGSTPHGPQVRDHLLTAYAEPHRRYHDLRHLAEVLAAIDRLATTAAPGAAGAELGVVQLAAWFHDTVYDPTAPAGDNEEASARLAEQLLPGLGLGSGLVARVAALVRGTATHTGAADPTDERAAAVLDDADLAILASAPDRYADYAAAVREEYAHVPDPAFRAGRREILLGFLDRPRIYRTPAAYDAWEIRARTQVSAEVERLGRGPDPDAEAD